MTVGYFETYFLIVCRNIQTKHSDGRMSNSDWFVFKFGNACLWEDTNIVVLGTPNFDWSKKNFPWSTMTKPFTNQSELDLIPSGYRCSQLFEKVFKIWNKKLSVQESSVIFPPQHSLFIGCSTGQFYDNMTSQCMNCSVGEYAPGGAPLQYSCTSCPDGTTTLVQNASSSADCGKTWLVFLFKNWHRKLCKSCFSS